LPLCRIRHKGKKINGTKRHIAVDVLGLLLTVLVTAASVQDRDAAKPLLWNLRRAFPTVRLAWADGGYAGKLVTWAAGKLKPKLTLEIVKRPDDLHTFKVLPRRWVVERTLSWITRHRRTVRDYERLAAHHETYVYWAMIIVMTRRLARQPTTPGQQPPEFSSRLLAISSPLAASAAMARRRGVACRTGRKRLCVARSHRPGQRNGRWRTGH
jgi:transposase